MFTVCSKKKKKKKCVRDIDTHQSRGLVSLDVADPGEEGQCWQPIMAEQTDDHDCDEAHHQDDCYYLN